MEIELFGIKYTEADVPAQLAAEALGVQDTCNLGGVSRSFAEVVSALHKVKTYSGTEWIRHHPVVILFVSKIASLTSNDGTDVMSFHYAYELCKEVTNEQH